MGNFRNHGDIDDVQRRVGDSLDKTQFGLGSDRVLPGLPVAAIDQGDVDAKTRQQVLDDIQAGAEERPGRHHMVTGFEL